ncbi:MAG: PEP/pyruvate-binding domain-containing protein [Candidatus Limnocylindria bacterium]
MTSTAVRRLSEVGIGDVGEVGGKAAGLGELIAAGARVPDGVVLTAAAAAMTANEREPLLRAAVEELGAGPFAVRSSGVAEDGVKASFAGMYESVLNVSADELAAATDRTISSAVAARVAAYTSAGNGTDGRLAVIIQRMVEPAAAGVVLTADPITGDRGSTVISAVRGLGDRLVSGAAIGDEWIVVGRDASPRRQPEHALDRRQAIQVAGEARRIAAARGSPQDIEWAIDADGTLWILQARPMTALPPDVSWDPPAPGAYTRAFRFGEWISEPVTPLFESWLLTAMEHRLHVLLEEMLGERDPRPYHVVVNGWYYYSINWLSARVFARNLPGTLWHLIRSPRHVAGLFPATVRHSVPPLERHWREDLLPRYRAAVAAAEGRMETLPVTELPALIDELADLAGEYFTSIAALAGGAFKIEIMLAGFYRRYLASALGGSHLPLVSGFAPPADAGLHAVVSLDWWHPPSPLAETAATAADQHAAVVDTRRAAEEAAFRALASSPRRLRAFRKLLADTQHLASLREEQVPVLTISWPVMRRAVLRIGESLVARGVIADPDDVFFLTHDEVLSALKGNGLSATVNIAERRARREEQGELIAPLIVGRMTGMMKRLWEMMPRLVGAVPSDRALVSGTPASAGRATGLVRVVRGAQDFDQLQRGEILVAPLTAPAWTPLFTRAAAVVTDVGSLASHASIIAREYGIPAVVGCGDATARLRTGMRVTVDGSTGNVEHE